MDGPVRRVFPHSSALPNRTSIVGHCRKRSFFSYQLQAAFDVAHKLFGVVFEIRTGVPVYHPDVRAYEVKDADGFEAFKQRGLFDPDLALSYRKNILEAGGSEPPMEFYKRFRGAEPSIEPLLARRGLDTTG